MVRLTGVVPFLQTDRSGRLWAVGDARLALYDRGLWRGIVGTNLSLRSVAEDSRGQVLLGGTEGQLYTVVGDQVQNRPPPDGLTPSGVFCVTDAQDGTLWLANKGFIGRLTSTGWLRSGPPREIGGGSGPGGGGGNISRGPPDAIAKSLLAAPAQTGGLWVYTPGELRRYQTDGTVKSFPAPDLDQPHELMEDRAGIKRLQRGHCRTRLSIASGRGFCAKAVCSGSSFGNHSPVSGRLKPDASLVNQN